MTQTMYHNRSDSIEQAGEIYDLFEGNPKTLEITHFRKDGAWHTLIESGLYEEVIHRADEDTEKWLKENWTEVHAQ